MKITARYTWCVADKHTGRIFCECCDRDHAEAEARDIKGGYVVALPDYNRRCYRWDHWQVRALIAGLDEELSWLGRELLRETHDHVWPEALKQECGWEDDGAAMLALALASPEQARARWRHLLATNGERLVSD